MPRRFQFSIWNILAATFWASMCLGAYSILQPFTYTGLDDNEAWIGLSGVIIAFWLYVLLLSAPFIAVGALLGRTRTGAFVGSTFVLVILVFF